MAVAIMAAGLAGGTPVARGQEGEKATKVTLKVGDPAPKLQCGKFVQGEPVTELKKGTIYVIEFWATWCGPCTETIPELNALAKQYQDKGVVVIGQNVWEEKDADVKPFVKKMRNEMTYRVALDDKSKIKKGAMSKRWMDAAGQDGIPCAFVVGKDGTIAWIGHPMDGLDKVLANVVAGKAVPKLPAVQEEDEPSKEDAVGGEEVEGNTEEAKGDAEKAKFVSLYAKYFKARDDKRYDEAIAAIEQMLKFTLDDASRDAFSLYRVQLLVCKGDVPAALKWFAEAANKSQNSVDELLMLADVMARDTNLKPGLDLAETCVERARLLTKKGNLPDHNCDRVAAAIAMARGNKDQAIALQKKVIAAVRNTKTKDNTFEADCTLLEEYEAGRLAPITVHGQADGDMYYYALDTKQWDMAEACVRETARTVAAQQNANNRQDRNKPSQAFPLFHLTWVCWLEVYSGREDAAGVMRVFEEASKAFEDDPRRLAMVAHSITVFPKYKPYLAMAEKMATRANKVADGGESLPLRVLARLALIQGNKAKAIEWQKKAISAANPSFEMVEEYEKELGIYEKGFLPAVDSANSIMDQMRDYPPESEESHEEEPA